LSPSPAVLSNLGIALREAGTKINTAVRGLKRQEDEATSWMQRFIYREIEQRTRTRGSDHWERLFPGLPVQERARRRMQRMLTRGTVAGVAAAAGASTAEVLSIVGEGVSAFAAIPLGLASIGAEALYTTALQIDLAFDLAAIYGVPFARDDVGEISTLLALALGVDLVQEPTRHDKPAPDGETKPWRVLRQMRREDFAQKVSREVVQQALLRNAVPVLGVLVSAAWNQIVLRRFAQQVHTAVRQRLAITLACRQVQLGEQQTARLVLEGAWLMATADGDLNHQESLALAVLIDSLPLPERIAVHEASFPEDEEDWFWRVDALPFGARDVLVEVLSLVASADGAFTTPERRFLKRLSRTLGREIDLRAIERLVTQIRQGEAPERSPEQGLAAAPRLLPAS
jgi:tellurite resistance protein